jgi:energy-coupling factor transport system permease protein
VRERRLFRYVPGETLVHRMWAGTKIACILVLSLTLTVRPTFAAEAVFAGLVATFVLDARLQRSVVPRVPRWLMIGIGFGFVLAVFAGGPPNVGVGPFVLGLRGLIDWTRFTLLALLLASMGALLGWTTELADVAEAVRRLAAPARLFRLPVDELVLATGVAVRCLPLIGDDYRTLRAAWIVRAPAGKKSLRQRLVEVRDLLVAAVVSALRHAREMAEAMDARGGPRAAPRGSVRLGRADAIGLVVTLSGAAAMLML